MYILNFGWHRQLEEVEQCFSSMEDFF